MLPSGDSSHISQRLEVGRKALETLASIAAQLENAKDGLVRSAYLTANIEELPPGIRRLWESLDKDVMVMSAQDLAAKLLQLERLLTVRLAAVMPAVERICASDDRGEETKFGGMRAQLQDLSRLASTALAIRLLAHRKHFKFPPSQLPISSDVLRDKAQRVKKIERVHKLRVITHMKDMVKATTGMLGTAGLDAATKSMLQGVLRDLQSNARHLANGGSFASLPVPIEEVEMSEGDQGDVNELTLADDKPMFENAEPPKSPAKVQPTAQPLPASRKEAPSKAVPTKAEPTKLSATNPSATNASAKKPSSLQPTAGQTVPSKSTQVVQPKTSVPTSRKVRTQMIKAHAPAAPLNPVLRLWRHLRTWMKAPMGVTWSEARLMMHDEDDL
jgi:hypothetical protein